MGQEALAVLAATAGLAGFLDRGAGGGLAHEDDAPFLAPAAEAQGGFQRLPAVAALLPGGSPAHRAQDEVLDFGGVAQFEEVGQAAPLVFEHDGFAAVAAVAAGEGGPLVAGELFERLPEAGQAFGGGVLVSGAHFHAEADAQIGREVAVVDVAGAAGLLRVVADLRSLLAAMEGLDGDVDVEDPGQPEGRGDAAEDLAAEPVETGLLPDATDAEAHGVLADGAVHAEQAGIDAVAAHGVDVGVAPMAAQNAEHGGAHDVAGAAAAVAGVVEGAAAQELLPATARLQELEEEDELAFAGDGGLVVPLRVEAPAGGVDGPVAGGIPGRCFALTLRVSRNQGVRDFHAVEPTSFGSIRREFHFPL